MSGDNFSKPHSPTPIAIPRALYRSPRPTSHSRRHYSAAIVHITFPQLNITSPVIGIASAMIGIILPITFPPIPITFPPSGIASPVVNIAPPVNNPTIGNAAGTCIHGLTNNVISMDIVLSEALFPIWYIAPTPVSGILSLVS